MEQLVRNGLHPSGSPAHRPGALMCGFKTNLGGKREQVIWAGSTDVLKRSGRQTPAPWAVATISC